MPLRRRMGAMRRARRAAPGRAAGFAARSGKPLIGPSSAPRRPAVYGTDYQGNTCGTGTQLASPYITYPRLQTDFILNLIIQSGNGFHILKVLGRAGGAPPPEPVAPPQPTPAPGAGVPAVQGPMMVEQTRARHILIKTTAAVPSEVAKQKLDQVRERIVNGQESFSDLAKRFSNDSSAPQGGNLGWLNPGETVPPFEQAMKKLKIGEVSEPVQTTFGWHLIVVDERRNQDMAEQFQRNQVRQRLFAQRSEASFESWLQHLRNQSYIDNRLEKSQRQAKD